MCNNRCKQIAPDFSFCKDGMYPDVLWLALAGGTSGGMPAARLLEAVETSLLPRLPSCVPYMSCSTSLPIWRSSSKIIVLLGLLSGFVNISI